MSHPLLKLCYLIFLVVTSHSIQAQEHDMNNEKLGTILNLLADEIEGAPGQWQFSIDSSYFMCITDENNNRMRIISPIMESENMTDEEMEKCMEANFHTVLDCKYAISDGILWSAFIHPLKELTEKQVYSAVVQVYSTAATFGTYYSSGLLEFPGANKEAEKEPTKKKKDKKI